MPQFDFGSVTWPQLAWLAVLFAVLYFGVVKQTLPKLGKVMESRESKIAGDLATARTAKDTADSTSEAYEAELATSREASRAAIAEAKAKAGKASEASLAKAAAKADAQLAEAEVRIAASVTAADSALRDVAAENAAAIVDRLTCKAPALAAARQAVDALA
jgi:F-type H+-transporting ATPase subunit b